MEKNVIRTPKVLSFDPNVVKFKRGKDGKVVVEKKTTIKEYRQFLKVKKYLEKYPIKFFRNRFALQVPRIVSWDAEKQILTTEFCEGYVVEEKLRTLSDKKERMRLAIFFRNLISKMRGIGFIWEDFFPRNIIVNEKDKIVYIFDFERKVVLNDGQKIDRETFFDHFRIKPFEEIAKFFFEDERDVIFSGLLMKNLKSRIPIAQIGSIRKVVLLRREFGKKATYSESQLYAVEMLINQATLPRRISKRVYYPGIVLENIYHLRGPNTYVHAVKMIKLLSSIPSPPVLVLKHLLLNLTKLGYW